MNDEPYPAEEGGIDRLLLVRGEDRQAVIRLDPLEQIADLDIRVSVMTVTNLGPSPEHCIRFVEEQDRARSLRRIEEPLEVLLVSPMYLLTSAARSI